MRTMDFAEVSELLLGSDLDFFAELFQALDRPITRGEFLYALNALAQGVTAQQIARNIEGKGALH